jgi:hypothetical protein
VLLACIVRGDEHCCCCCCAWLLLNAREAGSTDRSAPETVNAVLVASKASTAANTCVAVMNVILSLRSFKRLLKPRLLAMQWNRCKERGLYVCDAVIAFTQKCGRVTF